jgi:hypothetical protein
MRYAHVVGIAVVLAGVLTISATTSANAKSCHYFAFNPWDQSSSWEVSGDAYGSNMRRLCDRAERRCLRRLRREWKKGKFQNFRCVRLEQAH